MRLGLRSASTTLENMSLFVAPTHPPPSDVQRSTLTLVLWWLLMFGLALPGALSHCFEATSRVSFLQRHPNAVQLLADNGDAVQHAKNSSSMSMQMLQLTMASALPGYWLVWPLVAVLLRWGALKDVL